MIKVNGLKIKFNNGMTVEDALKSAGKSPDALTLVVLNGKLLPYGEPYNKPLTDGSEIRLLPIVSGG